MNPPTKPSSPATRALWVIAGSLVLIAVCLVVIILQQVFPRRTVTEIPTPEAVAESAPTQWKAVPPLFRKPQTRTTNAHAPTAEAANSEPGTVVNSTSPVDESPAPPTAAQPEWQVSSGFAPLTGLQATDAHTVIRGRVTLKGNPPPERSLVTNAIFESFCGELPGVIKTTRRYVVSADGGLANVFVYIRSGLEGKHFAVPAEPALLEVVNCDFEPNIIGLMVNQRMRFKNSGPQTLTIFAVPTAKGTRGFNVTLHSRESALKKMSATAGPVVFTCSQLPWMFALGRVVEHPFFAVTDADGNYTITNTPPGEYVLEAYHVRTHQDRGELQPITVRSGMTTADFVIDLSRRTTGVAKNP